MPRKPAVLIQKLKDKLHDHNIHLGEAAVELGQSVAASNFNIIIHLMNIEAYNVDRKVAAYWSKKVTIPTFHSASHGGRRWAKYSLEDEIRIRAILWDLCKKRPTHRIREYRQQLRELNFHVSREYIQRIFRSWNWTWKKVQTKQINKYNSENILRYIEFLNWINTAALSHVKFLDEGHFVSR